MAKTSITKILSVICVLAVYLCLLDIADSNILQPTAYNYYNLLAESFLEGRVDIDPLHETRDLSAFNGKYFLYWGPAPAILIAPFQAVFGIFSDRIVSIFTGIFCLLIWLKILSGFTKAGLINFSFPEIIIGALFSVAGTQMLYNVNEAKVWGLSHSFSFLFCSASLLFLIKAKKSGALTAIALFGCACLTRLSLFYIYPFLAVFALYLSREKLKARGLAFYVNALQIFLVFMLPVAVQLLYNLLRFDNILDFGQLYQLQIPSYKYRQELTGTLSAFYFTDNLKTYLLDPVVYRLTAPYVLFSRHGNAFWSYQLDFWIIAIFLMQRTFAARKYIFNASACSFRFFSSITQRDIFLFCSLVWLLYFVMLLHLFATGFINFGGRYLIDILPFQLVMSAVAYSNIKKYRTLKYLSLILAVITITIHFIVKDYL